SMPRAAAAVGSRISKEPAASSLSAGTPSSVSEGRVVRARRFCHCASGRLEITSHPIAPARSAAMIHPGLIEMPWAVAVPMIAAGLQAEPTELVRDIARYLLKLRARRRPTEHGVVREDANVVPHILGGDRVDGALDGRRSLRRESAWDEQRTQTEQLTHGWAPAKERDRKLTRPTRGGLWPSASHRFTPDYGLRRLSSGSFLGFSRGASRFGSARGSLRGGAAGGGGDDAAGGWTRPGVEGTACGRLSGGRCGSARGRSGATTAGGSVPTRSGRNTS